MRGTLAVVTNFLALVLYGLGIIGPLTPSSGVPSPSLVLIFAGGPSVMLLLCAYLYGRRATRVFALVQAAVVLGFAGWMLWLQLSSS